MAVVRTVLPRKGIIQPQHGDNYEADLDANWLTLDSSLQDASDVQAAVIAAGTVQALLQDLGISGVTSGLALSTSASLTPGLSSGTLYAQGQRFSLSSPAPGAAPANSTSFLWYNSTAGFYFNATGVAGTAGDALVGEVVTNLTAVTAVTPATKIFGQISVTSASPGNFSVAHLLGRAPRGAVIRMTSGGAIWFQAPTDLDATNLYLVASDAGVTAKVIVW
jgi:hypothetical protein